ncbi:MAG: dTMP kinase [Planctomycetes bacterium]|nr:dTMP kinase [Planctomycetota bacterium]
MNWDKLNGKFIVLDGVDGAGKSSQVGLLASYLSEQNVELITVRDPGGTDIGEQIRQILLKVDNSRMLVRTEALLYMASRAQLYGELIGPALEAGQCVLCDRWVSSTYAYQARAGAVGAKLVLDLAEAALERTWADLTILIDLPIAAGLERVGKTPDRMESKGEVFHQRVREAFLELAQTREEFRIVDGSGGIEEVHQKVREVVEDYVNS